jgi:hypothetical protein
MVSNTRLYGAVIAFTSGMYSLWSATSASSMTTSSWLMIALGAVVIAHGAVLLTAVAESLGGASGPLMIAYSAVMLLNQALLATGILDDGSGMGMNGGMGSSMTGSMGWDVGMVALAVLMLSSGVIMTRGGSMSADSDRM